MKTHCYNCIHFLTHPFYCSFWGVKLSQSTMLRLSNEGCARFEFVVIEKK